MRITGINTYHVAPRWLFVKISTDVGIDGWGEPIVEGRARTTATAVAELGEYLVGQDPRRIEHHWQAIYRGAFYRGGPVLMSALSGIEQAMWDIKGKDLNVPVYDLLGGHVRDRIAMYAHVSGDSTEDLIQSARNLIQRGFDTLKVGIAAPAWPLESPAYVDHEVERFGALRAAVGPSIRIAVDFHGRVSPAVAHQLIEALKPHKPFFVEEPVLPENPRAMIDVGLRTTVPIATGERLFTRWQFREVLESGGVSVLQPDLCHVGGIFEARKIAAIAETHYVSIAPHNPLGPISLASCLQLDACIPNFLTQEHPTLSDGTDLGQQILHDPFTIDHGTIELPRRPGLGVTVNEDALRELGTEGDWKTPSLRHADGSVADW